MLVFVVVGFALVTSVTAVVILYSKNNRSTTSNQYNIAEIYDIKLITIKDLDQIAHHTEFVTYIRRLITELGYSDIKEIDRLQYGADLFYSDQAGITYMIKVNMNQAQEIIQAHDIHQLLSGKELLHADQAMIISANGYSDTAFEEGIEQGVTLLNRDALIEIMDNHKNQSISEAKEILEKMLPR